MYFLQGHSLGDEESVAHDILFEHYLEIHGGLTWSDSIPGSGASCILQALNWIKQIHQAFQDVFMFCECFNSAEN